MQNHIDIPSISGSEPTSGDRLSRQDSLDLHKWDLFLLPSDWNIGDLGIELIWDRIKFTEDEWRNIPEKPGIYSFVIERSIGSHPCISFLMYIGKAKDQTLRARTRQYFYEKDRPNGRPKIRKLLTRYTDYVYCYFCKIENVNIISSIEKRLIFGLRPPANDDIPATLGNPIPAF
jgi:hypothetical protein